MEQHFFYLLLALLLFRMKTVLFYIWLILTNNHTLLSIYIQSLIHGVSITLYLKKRQNKPKTRDSDRCSQKCSPFNHNRHLVRVPFYSPKKSQFSPHIVFHVETYVAQYWSRKGLIKFQIKKYKGLTTNNCCYFFTFVHVPIICPFGGRNNFGRCILLYISVPKYPYFGGPPILDYIFCW